MDFSESDLKEMMPNKMGVVKKILKLQQEVGCNKLNKNIRTHIILYVHMNMYVAINYNTVCVF